LQRDHVDGVRSALSKTIACIINWTMERSPAGLQKLIYLRWLYTHTIRTFKVNNLASSWGDGATVT